MREDNSAQYQQAGDLPAVTLPHTDNTHHTEDINCREATSATDKVLRLCQMSYVIPNLMDMNSFVSQIHKMLIKNYSLVKGICQCHGILSHANKLNKKIVHSSQKCLPKIGKF